MAWKTWSQVETYLTDVQKNKLPGVRRKGIQAAAAYLRDSIRARHGVNQPGWPKSRFNNTPLLKTGALQRSVVYRTTIDTFTVFSKMDWLASIHEYGVTYRMTEKQRKFLFAVVLNDKSKGPGRPRKTWGTGLIRIPARPIWRVALRNEGKKIEGILDSFLNEVFE